MELECIIEDCRLLKFHSKFLLLTKTFWWLVFQNYEQKNIGIDNCRHYNTTQHEVVILWEAPFTYQISATHDSWYCLSLNWCWLLIVVPWKKKIQCNETTIQYNKWKRKTKMISWLQFKDWFLHLRSSSTVVGLLNIKNISMKFLLLF